MLPCVFNKSRMNKVQPFAPVFNQNKIHYSKQYGFQKRKSTEYTFIPLAGQILEFFENNRHTPGVFIDLSKAFYKVSQPITNS